MKYNDKPVVGLFLLWLFLILPSPFCFADWPEYRGNLQRTAFRTQSLQVRFWKPAWSQKLPAPQPAWSKPARGSIWQNLTKIEPRVTEDRANVPLIAFDRTQKLHVLVPSSGDDRLVSFAPRTGKVNWQFESNGPIRFAPSIQDGVAFVGSDDGFVTAVDLQDGSTLWSRHLGPDYKSIFGNGRIISAHPIRTSVLTLGKLVVAHAGLFPSQGVYSVALDKDNGQVIWRRRIDASSQGYLLSNGQDRIFVPTGRSVPYAIDALNGKKLYGLPSPGGSFCMLTPDLFFSGPGNSPAIESYSNSNKAKMLSFQARHVAVGQGKIWTANGSRLACHDLRQVADKKQATLWQNESKVKNGLIVSGNQERKLLFAASDSAIETINAADGERVNRIPVDQNLGRVVNLAVSEATDNSPETLVASTDQGYILAWHATQSSDFKGREFEFKPHIDSSKSVSIQSKSKPLQQAIKQLKSPKGLALVVGREIEATINTILANTELDVLGLVKSESRLRSLRSQFRGRGVYGSRVTIRQLTHEHDLPIEADLFNLVVNQADSGLPDSVVAPMRCRGIGVLLDSNENLQLSPQNKSLGVWRHQYAGPRNLADSQDELVGAASAFKLKWFGGVGPSRMPDRHLRGPAPLSAGASLVIQADGFLIGVDPANGVERWQLALPTGATRFVTPYDGGYACLNSSGDQLFMAANQKILQIDPYLGVVAREFECQEKDRRFGYLSEGRDLIVSTLMKPSAPRISNDRKTQRTYVDQDYRSDRPLVCSRTIFGLRHGEQSLTEHWTRKSRGLIPNGTISVDYDKGMIVMIEGRSKSCLEHPTDRITTAEILQDAYLVSISLQTGETNWEKKISWPAGKNILYTQLTPAGILLTTSQSSGGKAKYYFRLLATRSGDELWSVEHEHIKGGLYHGEQVHHPLILRRSDGESVIVAEPYLIELRSGKKSNPFPQESPWALHRPGHSCGTLSGSGNCLFFRANNPTVLHLDRTEKDKFTKLTPSRPGCWINIIPAGGRLLIPEASASCVCQYSLQTSFCFEPVAQRDLAEAVKILSDVLPRKASGAE